MALRVGWRGPTPTANFGSIIHELEPGPTS